MADLPMPSGELQLDPFAYQPGVASKISGLGGDARSHDQDYVFHTHYVEVEEGAVHFIVRFGGLAAKQGTLVLRVHMLPSEEGAHARLATSDRVALNRLIHHGGEYFVRFEGFHGVRYALYGGITGNTDASAQNLTVTLDRPADPNRRRDVAAEARSTDFGRKPVNEVAHLISMNVPLLAEPVAQIATAAQLAEPAAAQWLGGIDIAGLSLIDQWQAAYTLQALRRFGMLEKGARGLGLGLGDTPVPAVLAGHGIDVVATYDGEAPADHAALAARAPRGAAGLGDRVTLRSAALAPLPEDLVNFDFLWSTRACEQLGSVAAAAQFVEGAMACLRPGGIAVHTMGYDPFPLDQRDANGFIFQRSDAERLELVLISRRYEVAQFKLAAPDPLLEPRTAPGGPPQASAFGLIVRKPRLID